jgi:hypothetical protein
LGFSLADTYAQDKPHWNETQFKAFQAVMDAFHTFDNVAGFFVGNEVLTNPAGSPAAPFVKAAARDLKAYRDSKGYRQIPVGYSAADIGSLRPMLQNYLACGDKPAEAIDYFALNAYEWCGDSSYTTSGYSGLTANITEYNIPIFFSETGCNVVQPRTHADQGAIFGPEMTPYWSGAIIYEWIQEMNGYGLVQFGPHVDPNSPGAPPDGWPRSGAPIPVQPDFDNLKREWAAAKPMGVNESNYNPSLKAPRCPDRWPSVWEVDGTAPLPPPPSGAAHAASPSSSPSAGAKSGTTSSSTSLHSATQAVSIAVKTAAAVLTSASLAGRYVLPYGLLLALCWVAVVGTMPF